MHGIDPQIKQAYDNQYSGKESAWRDMGARHKAQNILNITGGKRFGKVLEVGAGDGAVLQALHQANFADEYYVCEISTSAVEGIKRRNLSRLKEVKLFDGYAIPYPDDYFDLVILTHVLEHVEHERILLRELRRVAPMQLIEVPRDYRFAVDRRIKHYLAYGHINVYTPTFLRFLLQTEGLEIMEELLTINDYDAFSYVHFENQNRKKTLPAVLILRLKYAIKQALAHHLPDRWRHVYVSNITFLTRRGVKQGIL